MINSEQKKECEEEEMLPEEFCSRMRKMLGEEYPAFLESYEGKRYQALRLNPLKGNPEGFFARTGLELEQVPWCREGFYYGDGTDAIARQPGKHPYHEAGVYYIQEPSAMAPVEYLDARPGMRILDLCAAPGGKSTQIAGKMQGQGILVSNEIHPARAGILSENMERMGVRNGIVTNETPGRLAEHFPEYFDRILVDAPCSGEGMFRKNDGAAEEWSPQNVRMCAERQDEILEEAYRMLAPGGRLVYSTCTFAPEEDEGSVARFLMRHSDIQVVLAEPFPGMEAGRAEWLGENFSDEHAEQISERVSEQLAGQIGRTIRLWPHHLKGEGHFAAVLEKEGEPEDRVFPGKEEKGVPSKNYGKFLQFAKENLRETPEGIFTYFGDQLYLLPPHSPSLKGLKVLRAGLHLGTRKKNRFEPSHALALALHPGEALRCARLSLCEEGKMGQDEALAYAYFRGETFPWEGEKGWYLIAVDDYAIGWGKLAGGIMKNHYPRGLRRDLSAPSHPENTACSS